MGSDSKIHGQPDPQRSDSKCTMSLPVAYLRDWGQLSPEWLEGAIIVI